VQLREYRTLPIGLKVDVASLNGAAQDPCLDEFLELALHGPLRGAGLAHDLAEIEPLLGVTEEPSQHPPACTAEQDR